MDLSYAQNLEDYYLSIAFAGQATGFYIDVGAGHPVADNVSCWFYLQGWCGIAVEPQPELAALYTQVRPRDTVAPIVLGRVNGLADFFHVERLHGFSTTIATHAEKARDFGVGHRVVKTPMLTLAALCARHNVNVIDFLKIDVEGAEYQVLQGGRGTLTREKRPVWLLEICLNEFHPGGTNPDFSEIFNLFWSNDYLCYTATEPPRLVEPYDIADWLRNGVSKYATFNYVFLTRAMALAVF